MNNHGAIDMLKKIILSFIFFSLTGLVIFNCSSSSSQPEIEIENVWSRPVTISAEGDSAQNLGYNGAVYLKLKNTGGASDRLIKAQTDVCSVTEIHESFIKDDRMMMEEVDGGIKIPAGGSAELKPGSYHLMLMGVKRSLSVGDSFAVQLKFEKSGIKTVYANIKKF